MCEMKDYSEAGMSVQSAMLDLAKQIPDPSRRPKYINWDDKKVFTGCFIDIPEKFQLQLAFISTPDDNQAVDLKIPKGYLLLTNGKKVQLLRTWNSPKYESIVEYQGISKDGKLFLYNVYKEVRNNRVFEEKWTNNAGFWYENVTKGKYRFHCSPGYFQKPDFESLIFELTISNN